MFAKFRQAVIRIKKKMANFQRNGKIASLPRRRSVWLLGYDDPFVAHDRRVLLAVGRCLRTLRLGGGGRGPPGGLGRALPCARESRDAVLVVLVGLPRGSISALCARSLFGLAYVLSNFFSNFWLIFGKL